RAWRFRNSARPAKALGASPRLASTLRGFGLAHLARQVPGDGFVQALVQGGGGLKVNQVFGPGDIETAARLTIGLAGIKAQLALESGLLSDETRQGGNRDLLTATNVHGRRRLQPLGGLNDGAGRILYMEEVSCGRAGSPHRQSATAFLAGFDAFANQS